jgi:hypothetical protein
MVSPKVTPEQGVTLVSCGTPPREILQIVKGFRIEMRKLVSGRTRSRQMCQCRPSDVPLSSFCRRSRLSVMDPNAVMRRISVPSLFPETRSGFEYPSSVLFARYEPSRPCRLPLPLFRAAGVFPSGSDQPSKFASSFQTSLQIWAHSPLRDTNSFA